MTSNSRDAMTLTSFPRALPSHDTNHNNMSAVGFCGDWFIFSCDTKLVAANTKQDRETFVFDCSTAEKRPKNTTEDNNSDGGTSEETGSDKVLAFAVSPSGKMVALTDDNKRLVLFQSQPSWKCVSVRWVVRRCSALLFSQTEEELLAADKSGDVYSFSVTETQKEGELKMGHLSMLLAVAVSPDNKFLITADRDEKIRVSDLRSPYNIQSFCLGHEQFVSALLIPAAHPHWLLSGSGDGTLKLWEFESGRNLQSCDLSDLEEMPSSDANKQTKPTVCRISSSPDAQHVAVLCDRESTIQFFALRRDSEEKMVPRSRLSLPHCPVDVTFDPEGRLWVLMDSTDSPVQIYSHRRDSWERSAEIPDLLRVTEALQPHRETLQASMKSSSRYEPLYKVIHDNVGAYLQRKQQRMDEQDLKRKTAQSSNGKGKKKKAQSSS
ncbi:tRNA (guanine-N(7)-)-methyltransferase non-catalytic subunit wdr4 [Notolabrus celidotus]|uniref:tRNA (guanine-N(7)-)-methyltransferase non-catalytic subunit wdr4 n=1 Tax=Notolabrus celidotus TaxID=1203425 RepID=UPI00148F9FF4|nr:tRNA (guanine-N(7)-)-methyltransferase non-catalytic subunit wdr4 [Notolabrus celidotus]